MNSDEKNKRAVAIKYDKGDVAPRVVAKGRGFVAQTIIDKGHEEEVAVYKDEKLVQELDSIDIGSNIPKELYEVVAQVLVFISDLDKIEKFKTYGKD